MSRLKWRQIRVFFLYKMANKCNFKEHCKDRMQKLLFSVSSFLGLRTWKVRRIKSYWVHINMQIQTYPRVSEYGMRGMLSLARSQEISGGSGKQYRQNGVAPAPLALPGLPLPPRRAASSRHYTTEQSRLISFKRRLLINYFSVRIVC